MSYIWNLSKACSGTHIRLSSYKKPSTFRMYGRDAVDYSAREWLLQAYTELLARSTWCLSRAVYCRCRNGLGNYDPTMSTLASPGSCCVSEGLRYLQLSPRSKYAMRMRQAAAWCVMAAWRGRLAPHKSLLHFDLCIVRSKRKMNCVYLWVMARFYGSDGLG